MSDGHDEHISFSFTLVQGFINWYPNKNEYKNTAASTAARGIYISCMSDLPQRR
jgi:hypothetical protein